MPTLDFLADDFLAVALVDIGVSITIENLTNQDINATTGAYTTASTSESAKTVVDIVTAMDIKSHPSILQVNDKRAYVREDDFTFTPQKGDIVTIGSNIYRIIEIEDWDGVFRLFLRRHL